MAQIGDADSDDEFAALLGAVRAAEPRADSDDELAAVLGAARAATPREQYRRRGPLLADHMRQLKASKRGAPTPIAEHVQTRIQYANEEWAVRHADHVDVTEKRPVKVRGAGNYRNWLPPAILRVCWGFRPRPQLALLPKRRARQKQPPGQAAPTVASARCIASFYRPGPK